MYFEQKCHLNLNRINNSIKFKIRISLILRENKWPIFIKIALSFRGHESLNVMKGWIRVENQGGNPQNLETVWLGLANQGLWDGYLSRHTDSCFVIRLLSFYFIFFGRSNRLGKKKSWTRNYRPNLVWKRSVFKAAQLLALLIRTDFRINPRRFRGSSFIFRRENPLSQCGPKDVRVTRIPISIYPINRFMIQPSRVVFNFLPKSNLFHR